MSAVMQQRMDALNRGNETRYARARVRKALSECDTETSKKRLAEIIERGEPCIQTMELSRLLRMCHRIGPAVSSSILRRIHASNMRTIGELTERQLTVLLGCLRDGG